MLPVFTTWPNVFEKIHGGAGNYCGILLSKMTLRLHDLFGPILRNAKFL